MPWWTRTTPRDSRLHDDPSRTTYNCAVPETQRPRPGAGRAHRTQRRARRGPARRLPARSVALRSDLAARRCSSIWPSAAGAIAGGDVRLRVQRRRLPEGAESRRPTRVRSRPGRRSVAPRVGAGGRHPADPALRRRCRPDDAGGSASATLPVATFAPMRDAAGGVAPGVRGDGILLVDSLAMAESVRDVFVVDAVRTPIGRYRGALAEVRPDDLGALVIAELVRRTGADPAGIDDVLFGCANQAGEDNRNVARMSAAARRAAACGAGGDGQSAVRLGAGGGHRRGARDRRRRRRPDRSRAASSRCRARRW